MTDDKTRVAIRSLVRSALMERKYRNAEDYGSNEVYAFGRVAIRILVRSALMERKYRNAEDRGSTNEVYAFGRERAFLQAAKLIGKVFYDR